MPLSSVEQLRRAAAFVRFFDGLSDAIEWLSQVEGRDRLQPFGQRLAMRRYSQSIATARTSSRARCGASGGFERR